MFEKLFEYFTKNGGLNTVTGTLIPAIIQVTAVLSPSVSAAIVQAFTPEVSGMLLQGGVGAVMAGLVIIARIGLALTRK